MTKVATKSAVGRFGVFCPGQGPSPAQAREIEALGYRTIWLGGSPPVELPYVAPLLEATTKLIVATSIVNIWLADARAVAKAFCRLDNEFDGRLLLGIGAGHPKPTAGYRARSYRGLVDYLDELDAYGVPEHKRIVAALGPRVLELAADRSAGAHPYLTTPEHTAMARRLIGPSPLLAPEHKVIVNASADQARALGRYAMRTHIRLINYANNWRRLGFTDADVAAPGSDTLIDALVAYGTISEIACRLNEHLAAGADHIAVQVLGGDGQLVPTLAALAACLDMG